MAELDKNGADMTIEETFAALDDLIGRLEGGKGSLEDAFKNYEEGMRLVKNCNEKIEKIEKQIMVRAEDRRRKRTMERSFKELLEQKTAETEAAVYAYLPEEKGFQKTIFEAMNYSVKAGGKRLRPLLMMETYRMLGGKGKEILPFMAAIEMIHTSSLSTTTCPAWITMSCAGESPPPGRCTAMIWRCWPETH